MVRSFCGISDVGNTSDTSDTSYTSYTVKSHDASKTSASVTRLSSYFLWRRRKRRKIFGEGKGKIYMEQKSINFAEEKKN